MNATSAAIHLINPRHRQLNCEGCALPCPGTFCFNRATVQFNQVPDDRQAEAHTTVLPASTLVRLTEPVEHERQEIRRDALTGIANNNLDLRVHSLQANLHTSAARSELDRV